MPPQNKKGRAKPTTTPMIAQRADRLEFIDTSIKRSVVAE
jgi:hypothetical protein